MRKIMGSRFPQCEAISIYLYNVSEASSMWKKLGYLIEAAIDANSTGKASSTQIGRIEVAFVIKIPC